MGKQTAMNQNGETIVEMGESVTYENTESTKKGRKQSVSISYTMRAMGENVKKLEELKLITEEEAETVRGVMRKAVDKWIMLGI